MDASFDPSDLRAEIDRFRENGGLGPTTPLRRLFDFLAEWSLAQKPVAEIDIAIEVFRRSGSDPGDASVRVYVHRLRKKLDDYYNGLGPETPTRLTIPRGEYRLAVVANESAAAVAPTGLSRRHLMWGGAAGGSLLAAAGAGAVIALKGPWNRDPYAAIKRSAVWAALVANPRPIYLVLGDYYIMGEANRPGELPTRMVREFDVNSRLDLQKHLDKHPEHVGRYVDLDLTYLPLSAALGLKNLLPFLHTLAPENAFNILAASEYQPDMLKSGHIVYVGDLGGLGALENTVFSGSRFTVAEDYPVGTKTYDWILDRQTSRIYPSGAGMPRENQVHNDFGYISSFAGLSGNRIVVLSGTRDVGVLHATDVATDPEALAVLNRAVKDAKSVEAVYAVEGIRRTVQMGALVIGVPRADITPRPVD
ncbi:MAG: helix-turn-helix domain-containing protein [Alphaproteobacteria bacterium]